MTGSKAEKTLSVLQVRDQCYALLDEIARTGKSVLITRMGKPFVELSPIRSRRTSR
jgi:antitoxin (DNA-binding transcriptional repressor) of toxin-antitoxin stability system